MSRESASKPSLRPQDRELVAEALERGYFDVPPEIKSAELADEFELSRATVKRRLARGMATLLTEHGDVPEDGFRAIEFADENV